VQAVPWAVPKVNCATNKADFNVPELQWCNVTCNYVSPSGRWPAASLAVGVLACSADSRFSMDDLVGWNDGVAAASNDWGPHW